MAFIIPPNSQSICGIKIYDEGLMGDLCSYRQQGRAVLNGYEAKNFKSHLENNMKHDVSFALVSLDTLKRREVTMVTRMFCKTVVGMEYVPNSMEITDCIETIKRVKQFQKITGQMENDSDLIILCDDKSQLLKLLIANDGAWNTAIDEAKSIMNNNGDCHAIPVLVDEPLCKHYFQNKDVTQAVKQIKTAKKRLMMDDTFTSELQKQREQPQHPDDDLDTSISEARMYISRCQQLSEDLMICSFSKRAEVASDLEDAYIALNTTVSTVTEALNKVKNDAMENVQDLKMKLQKSQDSEQYAQKELALYQNQLTEQKEMQEKSTTDLTTRVTELSQKLKLAEDGKEELRTAFELENKKAQVKIEEMELEKNEKIENLNDRLDGYKSDANQYATQLDDAYKQLANLSLIKMECDTIHEEAEAAKEKKHLAIQTSPIKSKMPLPMVHDDDSESDDDESVDAFGTPIQTPHKSKIMMVESETKEHTKKIDKFVATPAKFGIPIWNSIECNLLEHLMQCQRGLDHAAEKGCSLKEQINLLLLTLPREYQFVSSYLEENDKKDMGTLKKKVLELVMGASWDYTSAIINAHRRSDEQILSYFVRLRGMYMFCTGQQSDSDLDGDKWYTMMVYQKILETLPTGAKAEFQRDCEGSMTDGKLSYANLRKNVITIARKASVLQHLSSKVAVLQEPQEGARKPQEDAVASGEAKVSSVSENGSQVPQREQRTCFYCQRRGHIARNCYKKKRDNANKNREPTDKKDGRPAKEGTKK